MTERPRKAYVTSHNAMHRPSCRNVTRLKVRCDTFMVAPGDRFWGGWMVDDGNREVWPASCCVPYFRTREKITYVWENTDDPA